MKFIKKSVFGRIIYQCNSITATQLKNKLHVTVDNEPKYSAGFVNINSASRFFDEIDTWSTDLHDLGFEKISDTEWQYKHGELEIDVSYDTYTELFEMESNYLADGPHLTWSRIHMQSIFDVIRRVFDVFDFYELDPIQSACICDPNANMQAVTAAINSRSLSSKLQRVKSSNLWSYAFDVADRKSRFGTLLIQFKGTRGGPGDIYQYYDVPVNLWRRFISANSKGHFFWVYIRNNFQYRKLTGDKRGKLPNAIN